jgi:hypothetical protein
MSCRIVPVFLALLAITSCSERRNSSAGGRGLDSTQLVARARAALDSNRGGPSTINLEVGSFQRASSRVSIILRPTSRAVQGGGGEVRLDTLGRVLSVRGFQ